MQTEAIHPAVRIGHVHLMVADLDRSLSFYRDALGLGSDHGATVSVYLADPDGNGIEIYYDRPRSEWFDAEGRPVIKAERFDYRELLTDTNTNDPTGHHQQGAATRLSSPTASATRTAAQPGSFARHVRSSNPAPPC
jgi:catechol-2,3-dioxygenase